MGYNSKSDSNLLGASSGSALLQARLNHLPRTTFSFQLAGEQCRIGDVPVHDIAASRLYEDGISRRGPLTFEREEGVPCRS